MKAPELSRKYALAIFSQALETWLGSLNAVQSELAGNADLLASLEDSSRSFSQKQADLDKLIPTSTGQPVRNFLYTLLQEDDMALLPEVIAELERMTRGGPQVQVARVTTAVDLSDEEKDRFRQKLRAKYGQNLDFVFNVDPGIYGGVIVQIGDKVIDGSIAARLEALSQALGVRTLSQ